MKLKALAAVVLSTAALVHVSPASAQTVADGIWLSRAALLDLPDSGPAWDRLVLEAGKVCQSPDLANQDDPTNGCVMAKALVAARTDDPGLRGQVMAALTVIADGGQYSGRALSLGRELAAYIIAADLIDLRTQDPGLDQRFRAPIRVLLTTPTTSGPTSLVHCHEDRPNNWGTHCGASRIAVASYLGDQVELARAAAVFKGWLGDRTSYAGFAYGDLSWQCDPSLPVGINPVGCLKLGHVIDGVQPDDQRRAGSFSWPPPKENYVYEGLQGALAQAILLERHGYPAFQWEQRALLRAFEWLHAQAAFPAEGDDTWQPHIINHVYGATFPAPIPSAPGKNVGWTDWTHPPTPPPPPVPPPPGLDAPTDLVAVAPSVGSVNLTWTDNSTTETIVHVERSSGNGVYWEVAVLGADSTGYTDTTVAPSTTYWYRVRTSNDVGFSAYGLAASATTLSPPVLIKTMTFESGALKHASTGADATSGKVAIESSAPLKGLYSARFFGSSMYLEERFTANTDLYLSLYVRFGALPTSDIQVVLVTNAKTTVGNLVIRSSGRLRLRNNTTNVGNESEPMVAGQLYRIAIHQRTGTGGNAVLEAFMAADGSPFGAPFAATATGTWKTAADRVRIGATSSGSLNVIVDDAMVTGNAMAAPSD